MKVVFLTEYSKQIGYGHLSRCMSVADQFDKQGYTTLFLIREWSDEPLLLPYEHHGVEWRDGYVIEQFMNVDDICIIDTYRVAKAELNRLSLNIKFPISISDSKLNFPDKGMVIIASVYGKLLEHHVPAGVARLTGPEYLLFRKEYIGLPKLPLNPRIKKVVISIGGFATSDILDLLIQQITWILKPDLISVVGKTQLAKEFEKVQFLGFMSTLEYIDEISDADLMISNGGQSLNEAILIGIPTIAISIAENQVQNIKAWTDLGVIFSCTQVTGTLLGSDLAQCLQEIKAFDIREKLVEAGATIIDTEGSVRVYKGIVDNWSGIGRAHV